MNPLVAAGAAIVYHGTSAFAQTRLKLHEANPVAIHSTLTRVKLKPSAKRDPGTFYWKGNHYSKLWDHVVKVADLQPKDPTKIKVSLIPRNKVFRKITKRMPRRSSKTSRTRRVQSKLPFPKSRLVELKSIHQVTMDPAGSGVVSILSLDVNNPLDPIDISDSAGTAIIKAEAHPKYWDVYETIYERFEVIGYKVHFRFLSNNSVNNTCVAICPANVAHATETKAIMQTIAIFGARIKESHPEATVRYNAAASGDNDFNFTVTRKGNVRKQQPADVRANGTLIGKTLASDAQADPASIMKLYVAYGSINGTPDLGPIDVIVTMSQMVLFSGLPDRVSVGV